MKKSDLLLSVLFLIVMVVLYFFGTCEWDLPALILGVVVTIVIELLWKRKSDKEAREEERRQASRS